MKTVLAGWCLAAVMAAAAPARSGAGEPGVDPLGAARKLLVAFEWDDAYDAFADIANAEPAKSERWAQAAFGAAVAISQGQPQSQARVVEATRLYQQILNDTPDSVYAARTLMNLARLKELRDYKGDPADLEGARLLYLKVAATWPNDPIAGEATFRAAAALIQQYDAKDDYAKVKQGVAVLEKWLADHPKEPLASAMWQYVGDTCFFPLNQDAKALAAYDRADALGWTDQGNQGPLLWRSAILSERIGNTPSAVRYYTKVVVETPNSGKAYEAQLALKRLGAPVPEINIFHVAEAK